MSITDMYTNNADLSEFLTNPEKLKVYEVHHSSSIQIEEGKSVIASGTGKHQLYNEIH